GPDLANVALLFMLVLVFAEVILAWQFGHYTTTEGAETSAPAGSTSTIVAMVIAVIATLIFAFGAIIVLHAKFTGDFLGFLPDILRQFLERDPVAAGESAEWKYVESSFLFGLPREDWWSALIAIGAIVMIVFIYKAEAPRVSLIYKLLLGALRLVLI